MPLDIVVAGLIAPADAPAALRDARPAEIEKWLARSDVVREPGGGPHGWVARSFGLAAPFPMAAICLAADDRPSPGEWLRADPVHLSIEGDGVLLHPPGSLGVREDEAGPLVEALQAHFAGDGLEFRAPVPERWYVRVPEGESPSTTPLEAAVGRDVFGLLPRSRGTFNWRSAITEAQMILSQHEVNVARENERRPAINSVWFWGEGAAPSEVRSTHAAVHADDPFTRGLAAWSGTPCRRPPESIDGVAAVAPGASVLVVHDSLSQALASGDAESWQKAVRDLELRWFAGLSRAISRFGAVRLALPGPRADVIATLEGNARRRWLRPRKALASYA